MPHLVLVANPGSASRKYALYKGGQCLARIHFEHADNRIIYTYEAISQKPVKAQADISHLTFAATKVWEILQAYNETLNKAGITALALRVVAPSSYFQKDRLLDKTALKKLANLEPRAPLHINALLAEAELLAKAFPEAKLLAISDSAFHTGRSEVAASYAIPFDEAKRLDIRRFGYHGLSAESVVRQLKAAEKLPPRLVICHLGSGASATAVLNGKSVDNTMGYSPISGLIMATRAGDIDISAALALKVGLKFDDEQLQAYLNEQSGLLGVSGTSPDIRQLIKLESQGHAKAALALDMYVYRVCQAIGQMAASLKGLDGLVFTGVVGERSAEIRRRVVSGLLYLGLALDSKANHQTIKSGTLIRLSPAYHPAKVYTVHADETKEMIYRAAKLVG